ncbi:lipocalin family protein [Hymenobacter sp. DG01]|uniref:lipocalin family protein n=1 Tax=Hymenobacter sp. DG01 TaxID=2584940 RepID=UPI001122CDFF|nr:lipocalin family protein [Hymenobacter sp. DG01]
MKRISFLLSLLVAGSVFTGCGSDDETPSPNKSKSELLMAKSWRMTAQTETVGSKAPDDTFSSEEACSKDDLAKFMANGIFIADEGKTKCDPDDSQQFAGNWALSANDTKLTITVFIAAAQFDITELTENKLVLTSTDTDSGVTTTTRTTYVSE